MPCQTVGNLRLDFPDTTQVEIYRRGLNVTTATASDSYTAGASV